MARVTAPLLSFGGAGQIGKSIVYGSWKGIPYGRRYVVPANPRSTEQTKTRSVFSWLNAVWKVAPANFQAPWLLASKGRPLTDRNLFMAKNISNLRDQTDLIGFVMSPGAGGGLTGSFTFTPAAGQVTVAGTPPDPLPAGWSIVRMVAAAVRQQDPNSGTDYDVVIVTDDTSPYSAVITGLAADDWMVGAWFVYQKSSLATDLAYGPSTATVETVT